jgi:segregation and condensation protein B
MEDIKNIIESLLFVADEPLSLDRIKKVLETADTPAIKKAIAELQDEYETRKGGFTLREVAGGFQFRTRTEYSRWIKNLVQPGSQRLSKAALETLAIIAYKQPLIRSDIEFIRGVDCGGVLKMLLEKKLVRVLGKKEIPGRPLIYATTKQFLEIFDLKDLNDLPSPREIQELGNLSPLENLPIDEGISNAGDFAKSAADKGLGTEGFSKDTEGGFDSEASEEDASS